MTLKEDHAFDKRELIEQNERFLQGLRAWHPERETQNDNPRAVQPEHDVRYRKRDKEYSSGCSSSAGWDI